MFDLLFTVMSFCCDRITFESGTEWQQTKFKIKCWIQWRVTITKRNNIVPNRHALWEFSLFPPINSTMTKCFTNQTNFVIDNFCFYLAFQ